MVIQEIQQIFRLFLLEAHDRPGESLVNVQRLLAGDGVYAHERMLGLDGLAAHRSAALAREFSLVYGGVQCTQAQEAFLELGGEAVVCLNLGKEEGIATADLGLVEDEEEGRARGLLLVGHVRVPGGVVCTVGTGVFLEAVVFGIAVH